MKIIQPLLSHNKDVYCLYKMRAHYPNSSEKVHVQIYKSTSQHSTIKLELFHYIVQVKYNCISFNETMSQARCIFIVGFFFLQWAPVETNLLTAASWPKLSTLLWKIWGLVEFSFVCYKSQEINLPQKDKKFGKSLQPLSIDSRQWSTAEWPTQLAKGYAPRSFFTDPLCSSPFTQAPKSYW